MDKTEWVMSAFIALMTAGFMTASGWIIWAHWDPLPSPRPMVTVDLVRILNAERKALPKLSGGGDPSLKLLQIGRQIKPTVERVADGAVVLVKQSVVGGDLPDITDKVLDKLGLPKNAPTINLTGDLNDAPTTSSATVGAIWKAHLRQMQQQAVQERASQHSSALNQRLP